MVSLNTPFVAYSKEEADDCVKVAKAGAPEGIFDGDFVFCHFTAQYRYYIYKFTKSLQANVAKVEDFAINKKSVETDEILLCVDRPSIYVDLRVTTVSLAEEAIKTAIETTVDRIAGIINSNKEIDKVQLAQIAKSQIAICQSPAIHLPEIANSQLMWSAISKKGAELGYIVTTNKSKIAIDDSGSTFNPQASKYFSSKPDLVLYNPKKLRVFVVVTTDDEEDGIQNTVLNGVVTENKLEDNSNAVGQLLAGMEKVTGDLACIHLQDGDIPSSEKEFRYIQVFGLIIDFEKLTCKAYKLLIDFCESTSTLYCGKQELQLNEGVNRLLKTLEQDGVVTMDHLHCKKHGVS